MLALLIAAVLAAAATPRPFAPSAFSDSALVARLVTHRQSLALADGRFTGAGAEWLVQQARAAQFVAVGEDHGIAEIPWVVDALHAVMSGVGPTYYSVEVGPLTTRALAAVAAGGEPALKAALLDYPAFVPFISYENEATLLVRVMARSRGLTDPVWGTDQEFVTSELWALREIAARPIPAPARGYVAGLRADAQRGLTRMRTLDQGDSLLLTLPEGRWVDSLVTLVGARDARARDLALALQASQRVYALNTLSRGYESNYERAELQRRTFVGAYRAAERRDKRPPRVLLKYGAYHMFRGVQPLGVQDLGDLVANLATYEGARSFHLLVLPGAGTRTGALNLKTASADPTPIDVTGEPWALPFYAAADSTAWCLFDLAAIRREKGWRARLDPAAERVMYGYDAVLILGGSTPSALLPTGVR